MLGSGSVSNQPGNKRKGATHLSEMNFGEAWNKFGQASHVPETWWSSRMRMKEIVICPVVFRNQRLLIQGLLYRLSSRNQVSRTRKAQKKGIDSATNSFTAHLHTPTHTHTNAQWLTFVWPWSVINKFWSKSGAVCQTTSFSRSTIFRQLNPTHAIFRDLQFMDHIHKLY